MRSGILIGPACATVQTFFDPGDRRLLEGRRLLESLAANAVRVAPTGLVSPTLTLDVRITKMKDGRTHLTHKAEYAIDIETGAIVAITLHGADEGDTETIQDTVAEAGERITSVVADSDSQVAHHQQPEVDL